MSAESINTAVVHVAYGHCFTERLIHCFRRRVYLSREEPGIAGRFVEMELPEIVWAGQLRRRVVGSRMRFPDGGDLPLWARNAMFKI